MIYSLQLVPETLKYSGSDEDGHEMETTVIHSQLKGTEPFYAFPTKSIQSTANIGIFLFYF